MTPAIITTQPSLAIHICMACLFLCLSLLSCSGSQDRSGGGRRKTVDTAEVKKTIGGSEIDQSAGKDVTVLGPGDSPPDKFGKEVPCYLDTEVEKVVLEFVPSIKGANFRSWPSKVLLASDNFHFVEDAETFKIPTGEGDKTRRRTLLEQLLWVCSSADKPGWPARHPASCKDVGVETTEMIVKFGDGLEVTKSQPDADSKLTLTITKAELSSEPKPLLVKDLSQFDLKWKLRFQADDPNAELKGNYLFLKKKPDDKSGTKIGHIPAAYPPIKGFVLKVNDHKYFVWDVKVGNLYYAKPAGFFKPQEHAEVGKGVYTLDHKPGVRAVAYNHIENPFTHGFSAADMTKTPWWQAHKAHCDSLSGGSNPAADKESESDEEGTETEEGGDGDGDGTGTAG